MRLVARPLATARVEEISAGEFDLIPLLAQLRGGLGLLLIEGVVALDVQVGDRTASELVGAGDLLAPVDERRRCRAARLRDLLARARAHAGSRARRGVRAPHPAVAADPARAAAARGAPHDGAERAPRGDVPSSRRRPDRAAALAPGGALGRRGRRRDPRPAPAHAPADRPARRRRAAVGLARARAPGRAPAWSRATRTASCCTAPPPTTSPASSTADERSARL